jgi:hypothetical protein
MLTVSIFLLTSTDYNLQLMPRKSGYRLTSEHGCQLKYV